MKIRIQPATVTGLVAAKQSDRPQQAQHCDHQTLASWDPYHLPDGLAEELGLTPRPASR